MEVMVACEALGWDIESHLARRSFSAIGLRSGQ
jgi:hypothetical protein